MSGDIKVEKSKMKWDPKTLEIRTHSVEKTLEPLVHQVRFVCLTCLSCHSVEFTATSEIYSTQFLHKSNCSRVVVV